MGVAGQSVKGRTKVEVARMIQAIKVWYRKVPKLLDTHKVY